MVRLDGRSWVEEEPPTDHQRRDHPPGSKSRVHLGERKGKPRGLSLSSPKDIKHYRLRGVEGDKGDNLLNYFRVI